MKALTEVHLTWSWKCTSVNATALYWKCTSINASIPQWSFKRMHSILNSVTFFPVWLKSYQSNVNIYALFHWHSSPLHLIYFLMFFISLQNTTPLFFNECPQRKTLSDDWINSLFFILFITYTVVIHMMYNRVLYIWSWFFPITILYRILILPRHYLICDPDSSPPLSYIWSWFFPVTVLYMILILPRHCLIYDPDSSPWVPNNTDLKDNWNLSFIQYLELHFTVHGTFIYIAWQFSPYGEEEILTQNKFFSLNRVSSCKPLGRT